MIAPIQDLAAHLLESVFNYSSTKDVLSFSQTGIVSQERVPQMIMRWNIPLVINANPADYDEIPVNWEIVQKFLDSIEQNPLWRPSALSLKYVLSEIIDLNFSLTPFEKLKELWIWDVSSIKTVNIEIDAGNIPRDLGNLGTNQVLNLTHVVKSFPELKMLKVALRNADGTFMLNFKCTLTNEELTNLEEPLWFHLIKFHSEKLKIDDSFADSLARFCPELQCVEINGEHFSTFYGSDRKVEIFSQLTSIKKIKLSSWYDEFFSRDELSKMKGVAQLSVRLDTVTCVNRLLASCPNLETLAVTGSNVLKHPKVTLTSDSSLKWDFESLEFLRLIEFPVSNYDFVKGLKNLKSLSLKWMSNEQAETQLIYLAKCLEANSEKFVWPLENVIIEMHLDADLMSSKLKRKLRKSLDDLMRSITQSLVNLRILVVEVKDDGRFLDLVTSSELISSELGFFRVNENIHRECSSNKVWNTIQELEERDCSVKF